MKIEIKEFCIRCGICTGQYPELFVRNFEKDRIDVVKDPDTPELLEEARAAARDCAVTAIFLLEE